MRRLFLLLAASLLVLITASCGSGRGTSAPPPASIAADAGDGVVTVTWPMASGVDYWLFYAPSAGITTSNWTAIPDSKVAINVASPYVATGLVNNTLYSFVVNARIKGGPGGPDSATVAAIPRLAGTATASLPAPWTAAAALGANDMRGLALGPAVIAVGAKGAIHTSANGITWTAVSSGVSGDLNAAAYLGGAYVTVGDAGMVLYSVDTQNWTTQTSGNANNLYAIASSATTFVAVGAKGTILSSSDGRTWTAAANSATTNDLYAVTYYGGGIWIAAGAGGTLIYSADASNWTAAASHTSLDLTALAFGVSTATSAPIFVAMGANGTLITSTDILNWNVQPAVTANGISAVTYGTQFVAVGANGTILTSSDGTIWAAQPSTTNSRLNAVAHAPVIYGYIAVGAAGTNLLAK